MLRRDLLGSPTPSLDTAPPPRTLTKLELLTTTLIRHWIFCSREEIQWGSFLQVLPLELKRFWYFFSTEDFVLSCDSKHPPPSGPVTWHSAAFSEDSKYHRYRLTPRNYQTQIQFGICRHPVALDCVPTSWCGVQWLWSKFSCNN